LGVAADCLVRLVVGEDEEDVRPGRLGGRRDGRGCNGGKHRKEGSSAHAASLWRGPAQLTSGAPCGQLLRILCGERTSAHCPLPAPILATARAPVLSSGPTAATSPTLRRVPVRRTLASPGAGFLLAFFFLG